MRNLRKFPVLNFSLTPALSRRAREFLASLFLYQALFHRVSKYEAISIKKRVYCYTLFWFYYHLLLIWLQMLDYQPERLALPVLVRQPVFPVLQMVEHPLVLPGFLNLVKEPELPVQQPLFLLHL